MAFVSMFKSFPNKFVSLIKKTPPLVFAMTVLSFGGLIGASTVLVKGIKSIENSITVTGTSTERIESDLATWLIKVESSGKSQISSYNNLKGSMDKTISFLSENGIKNNSKHSLDLWPAESKNNEVRNPENGELVSIVWTTSQWIRIGSNDVWAIYKTHQKIGELLGKGVLVKPNGPEYTYSKLAEKRIDMLSKATKDARLRAEAIAREAGSSVGSLKKVNTGVFQITIPNSTRVSSYGSYDTRTIKKDITAVMGVTFQVK